MGKELEERLEVMKVKIKENPDNAQAWFDLGRIYLKLGKQAEALTAFRTSNCLNSENQAKHAIEMIEDITSFINTDLMNP